MVHPASPVGSTTPTIQFEELSEAVIVTPDFSWENLYSALSSYEEQIRKGGSGIAFADRLRDWLNDPKSQEIDPKEALEMWADKAKRVSDVPDLTIFTVDDSR